MAVFLTGSVLIEPGPLLVGRDRKISSGSIYNLLVADLPSFVQRYIIRYLIYLHSSCYILLSSEKFFILQENDAAPD